MGFLVSPGEGKPRTNYCFAGWLIARCVWKFLLQSNGRRLCLSTHVPEVPASLKGAAVGHSAETVEMTVEQYFLNGCGSYQSSCRRSGAQGENRKPSFKSP